MQVGSGFGKILKIGPQPATASLQTYYNADKSDPGRTGRCA